MRRLLLVSALLTLALLPQATPASVTAGPATDLLGDADCSGSVNPVDGLVILRHDAGSGNAPCVHLADVQCDDDIDPVDALQLLRFDAGLSVTQDEGCTPIGGPVDPEEPTPTSEALIAQALASGDITYEESLLYRAYALYDHPDLPDEFRSPIIDWHAASELFGEVDENEAQLNAELLSDLEPFRSRPNDPISIFNNSPAAVVAQGPAWVSEPVPGTNARVWIKGTAAALTPYKTGIQQVWNALPGIFRHPNPDQAGNPSLEVNPDNAIDFYIVDASTIDPREAACVANPNDPDCVLGNANGYAQRAPLRVNRTSSGYLVISRHRTGDNLLNTAAHELTHVSQYSYDTRETGWLYESTATWAAYKVVKKLNRTPHYPYDRLPEFFKGLELTLTYETPNDLREYGSWLFFQHAAMVAGDSIVSSVWTAASVPGTQGIDAVDVVFPLDDNFDEFTVRNWNQKPPLIEDYADAPDATFPDYTPELDRDTTVPGEADYNLDLPVEPLSARYYRFAFNPAVRHIIVENNLVETDHAHVWLLKKIDGDWKPPEDMAGAPVTTFCRDAELFEENLEELIVIVSNSALTGPPIDYNDPRVIADEIACEDVTGWASTSLRIQDDLQDITYQSGVVNLRFKPRDIQDVPGNINYDLTAQSQGVHWVASGTYGGCPAEGEATVLFPGVPYTGIENAAGYLVVVAPGDNHSVLISAFDPSAFLTVTCPTEPEPTISKVPFQAGYLLHILGWPNSDNGTAYKGDCLFRPFEDTVYHFTWDLRAPDVLAPLGAAQPAGPVPECFDIPSPP